MYAWCMRTYRFKNIHFSNLTRYAKAIAKLKELCAKGSLSESEEGRAEAADLEPFDTKHTRSWCIERS